MRMPITLHAFFGALGTWLLASAALVSIYGCSNKQEGAYLACEKAEKPDCYRQVISIDPSGKYALQAEARLAELDDSAWKIANTIATDASYQSYISSWPGGKHVEDAHWEITKAKGDKVSLQKFLESWPRGTHADDALWEIAKQDGTTEALKKYIQGNPNGRYVEDAYFKFYEVQDTAAAYKQYITERPNGKFIATAHWRVAEFENSLDQYYWIASTYTGEYGEKAKAKIQSLHNDRIRSVLSGFSRHIVNTCFIGGQDIDYEFTGIEYDRSSDNYKMNLTVSWSGMWMRDNKYHVSGDFSMNDNGSKYKFIMRGGLSWDGSRCANPLES